MDKYNAIYVQRQITQTLNFVLQQKDALWRLNWYNEVKIPLLSALILFDSGENHLQTKIDQMNDFAKKNPDNSMNIIQDDALLDDEDFL